MQDQFDYPNRKNTEPMTTSQEEHIQQGFKNQRGGLLGFIRKRVPRLEDAEDILQDVFFQFISAYDSIESLDKVIANPEAETQKVTIRMQNNQSQQVPAKAACLNVKGIIAMELNQTDVAKQNFQAALSKSNDFELAQGNLATLAQKKQAATTAPKATTPAKPAGK